VKALAVEFTVHLSQSSQKYLTARVIQGRVTVLEDNTVEAKANGSTFRGKCQFCDDPDPGILMGSMPTFSKPFDT